jgi:predicted secreted protein
MMTIDKEQHMTKDEALARAEHALDGVLQAPERISMMYILETVRFIRQACEAKTDTVNLDTATGFTFSDERGTFIGDVQMLKWLVEHHSEDYWKAKAGETK